MPFIVDFKVNQKLFCPFFDSEKKSFVLHVYDDAIIRVFNKSLKCRHDVIVKKDVIIIYNFTISGS